MNRIELSEPERSISGNDLIANVCMNGEQAEKKNFGGPQRPNALRVQTLTPPRSESHELLVSSFAESRPIARTSFYHVGVSSRTHR